MVCVLPSKAISAALGGLANLEGTLFREPSPCPVVRILAAASREALEKHSHNIVACSMDLTAMGLLAHHHCYTTMHYTPCSMDLAAMDLTSTPPPYTTHHHRQLHLCHGHVQSRPSCLSPLICDWDSTVFFIPKIRLGVFINTLINTQNSDNIRRYQVLVMATARAVFGCGALQRCGQRR